MIREFVRYNALLTLDVRYEACGIKIALDLTLVLVVIQYRYAVTASDLTPGLI